MATTVEFTVPANEFAFGQVFERLPEAVIELERVVPTDDRILPYFWLRDGDAGRAHRLLSDETAFLSVELVDDFGTEGLFRAEWDPGVEGVITAIARSQLTLLSAVGAQGQWTFEFRSEDSDRISTFQRYCTDRNIEATLTRLKPLAETRADDRYNLTANQYEALVLALDEGYYDDPRDTDLQTLADRVGISRPAFAGRLRRGIRNVLDSTIARTAESDGHPG